MDRVHLGSKGTVGFSAAEPCLLWLSLLGDTPDVELEPKVELKPNS